MTRLPFDPDLAAQPEHHTAGRPFDAGPSRRPTRPRLQAGQVFAVAVGGAIGGCARYGVDMLVPTSSGELPWSTLSVNVAGALLLALLLILVLEVWPPTRYVRPFLAVGVLGSFTTFSTLMVDVDQLLAGGHHVTAAAYLAASLAAGLAATGLGLLIGRGVVSRRTASRQNATR